MLSPAAEPFFGKPLDVEMQVLGGGTEHTAVACRALLASAG